MVRLTELGSRLTGQLPDAAQDDPETLALVERLARRVATISQTTHSSVSSTVPALSKDCANDGGLKSATEQYVNEDQMTHGGKPSGNWIED